MSHLRHPSPAQASRLATARTEFAPEAIYLDTATMGLPPRRTVDAVTSALARWRSGSDDPRVYDDAVDSSRRSYATMMGVDPSWVAVGAQVSSVIGLAAASLPPGSEVLTATDDHTSVLFPFHAQASRGIRVREVPLERLVDAVDAATSLVAVSAVQSADGRIADLDGLAAANAATGVRTLIDTTQAAGWLPIDAARFSFTTGGGYKWLLAPRGTAFLTVRPEIVPDLVPAAAGWYAGEERWSSSYGSPLRLARDARRFDVSPAWHAWAGQDASLRLLAEVGAETLHLHSVSLANRFLAAVDQPPTDSAIVALDPDDEVSGILAKEHIAAANRNGRLRLSFHVATTEDDVDRAAAALRGHVRR